MQQTTLITQSLGIDISTIVGGACYELLLRESESDKEAGHYQPNFQGLNRCTFRSLPAETANGPSSADSVKFRRLVAQWHSERDVTSSVTEMVTCPSYQRIIGMGGVAVPLILSELQSEGPEPDHWFWALRVLTDADPVAEEDRGDIVKMAAAWLEWGRAQGYAW